MSGAALMATGDPVAVKEAQCLQGFAHVEEDCLEELLNLEGTPVPSEALCAGDKRLEYIMALTTKLKPAWTMHEIMLHVHKGFPPPIRRAICSVLHVWSCLALLFGFAIPLPPPFELFFGFVICF